MRNIPGQPIRESIKPDMSYNKFTTLPQIEFLNSLIFRRNECELIPDERNRMSAVIDYIEVPAKRNYSCDACEKVFGIDVRPSYCPFCGSTKLKAENICEIVQAGKPLEKI